MTESIKITETEEYFFKSGCLIQLSMGRWGGIRRIPKATMEKMIKREQKNEHIGPEKSKENTKKWLHMHKKLVDPNSLQQITKNQSEARMWLASRALPFPIKGMIFVPKTLIHQINEQLMEFKVKHNALVNEFSLEYPTLRYNASSTLKELFNYRDYPQTIKDKFHFEWQFLNLNTPDGELEVLPPELYEAERKKFLNTMENAKALAISALRKEFSKLVSHLCQKLQPDEEGNKKIFHATTISNFHNFFETFKNRNIWNDKELSELVDNAQNILSGTDPREIRENDFVRESIQTDMAKVEKIINENIANMPKRKIILD